MTNTANQPQQNTTLDEATNRVLQQLTLANMSVVAETISDPINSGRRGYCPGVDLSVTHPNGATCSILIKHLNDHNGGLRATLTLPVPGTDATSVLIVRKEDPSEKDINERITALVSHAISVMETMGGQESLTDLSMP